MVLARGFAPPRGLGEVRRHDGTVLKRLEIAPAEALGGPMAVALRQALHGTLLDAVAAESIALAREATGFTTTRDKVTLHLANGEAAEGDLLIGADGMWSAIRRTLHPSEPAPRSSRIIAVRGAVHGAIHYLGDLFGIYYLGPGMEAFLARASDTGIYWALSLARELIPDGMRDPAAILRHMLPRMDATFHAVTSGTQEMRCDELFDRDPLPFWGTGAVTLLGDAAHPVLPHTGQGAAQAVVDAVTLGKALSAGSNIERALRAYEADRRPKTAALLAQGRRTARIMRTRNPVAVQARELVIRSIPVTSFVKFIAKINRRAGTNVMRAN
jgi:2-polyprenyl-6-methoxyphenol hydroxylase-like FAD-dependent oxidoreductase